jgi:hypothetical protein
MLACAATLMAPDTYVAAEWPATHYRGRPVPLRKPSALPDLFK